jgi:branched-chain amino acid transport system substrate-binding protein
MKMKKILAVLLITVLTAGLLTGCIPDDTGTVKIGAIAPMTGSLSAYGTSIQRGAQLAADEIGTYGGIKFDIRFEDDQNDPAKSVEAYHLLKEWKMQLFLGSATSAPAIATAELSTSDNIFSLNPTASALQVVGGTADVPRRENVFQLSLTAEKQGEYAALYINGQSLGTKVAVIYQSDDEASTQSFAGFKASAGNTGLNIVSESAFTAGTTDFTAQLTAARDSGADLVFLPLYYDTAALILTQANDLGYSPAFYGTAGLTGLLKAENFDTALAEGVMFLSSFIPGSSDEANENFVEIYQAKYGEAPDQFAAAAYDCVYTFYGSFTLAKRTSDMPATELTSPLAKLFAGDLVLTGLTGEDMGWDETGTVTKTPVTAVFSGGSVSSMGAPIETE